MNGITAPNRDAAIDIPAAATSDAEPKPKAGPMPRSSTLQYLRAEKFARYSLLVIVVFIGAVFLNMVKVFFVPAILAAVFAGLFHPFYEWLVKLARGRRAISAFVCCLVLSLGVIRIKASASHLASACLLACSSPESESA